MTAPSRDELTAICQAIDQAVDVERIYLFGSFAYGTPAADSDYDLCVVIPGGALRPAEAVKRIRRAVYPMQTRPLDVIAYRASVFHQRQESASLERKIARDGVVLYEREKPAQRMA